MFKDGATTLATVGKAAGATSVQASSKLAVGQHTLTATFTPSGASYNGSTATATVYQASVSATLKPTAVKQGTKPKLTVKLAAGGVTVSGKVKIVVTYAGKKGASLTKSLSKGSAAFTLPKAVKGKAKVTVSYAGGGSVLATSKKTTFKVT